MSKLCSSMSILCTWQGLHVVRCMRSRQRIYLRHSVPCRPVPPPHVSETSALCNWAQELCRWQRAVTECVPKSSLGRGSCRALYSSTMRFFWRWFRCGSLYTQGT